MKSRIFKEDLRLAKRFLNFGYPPFVQKLSLDMDIDYIAGLCSRFIKKEENLTFRLIDLEQDEISNIELYLTQNGTENDKIFFDLLLSVQKVLHKYYNADGTFKNLSYNKISK